MKFKIFTLGCKVNQYESQALRELFLKNGFEEVINRPADFYLVNTCTVTHTADVKSVKYIRKAKRENPRAIILVSGCLAQLDRDLIEKESVDFIISQSEKHKLLPLFSKDANKELILESFRVEGSSGYMDSARQLLYEGSTRPEDIWSFKISDFNHNRAFVKIQDGCDNFCSFCKVRMVRGPSVSRPLQAIVDEIRELIDKGFKEIVFCGIDLGSWRQDEKNLYHLLRQVIRIRDLGRIRLSSLEPQYIKEDLLDLISSSDKICNHLHIPFQSGSDKILDIMNKKTTTTSYFKLIDDVRKKIPDCGISADFMVGFPYEDDEDFLRTLELLKAAQPLRTHVFPYSERPGSLSAKFPKVDPRKIKNRVYRAASLAKLTSFRFRKTQVGKVFNVVLDGNFPNPGRLGYTDNYIRVSVVCPEIDDKPEHNREFMPVRICDLDYEHTYSVPVAEQDNMTDRPLIQKNIKNVKKILTKIIQ